MDSKFRLFDAVVVAVQSTAATPPFELSGARAAGEFRNYAKKTQLRELAPRFWNLLLPGRRRLEIAVARSALQLVGRVIRQCERIKKLSEEN